jgi:hypothetical protein
MLPDGKTPTQFTVTIVASMLDIAIPFLATALGEYFIPITTMQIDEWDGSDRRLFHPARFSLEAKHRIRVSMTQLGEAFDRFCALVANVSIEELQGIAVASRRMNSALLEEDIIDKYCEFWECCEFLAPPQKTVSGVKLPKAKDAAIAALLCSYILPAKRLFTAAGTILLAVATAYVALMGHRQLSVLEAEQRPWLFIFSEVQISYLGLLPPSTLTLPLQDRGWLIDLAFPIKNTGHAPAMRASIAAKFFSKTIAGWDGPEVLTAQQNFCADQRTQIKERPFEYYVPPNITVTMGDMNMLTEEEAQNSQRRDFVAPVLVGCILYYEYGAPDNQHQTGFIYDMIRRDRKPIDVTKVPLQASEFVLE